MERFNASDPPKYHPRDLQMGIGFRLKNAHPSRGNILAKRIPGSNSFEKKSYPLKHYFVYPPGN